MEPDVKWYLLSVLFGVIEGLTEFLPVSSTAHLRIAKPLVGVSLEDPYWKMYDVVIQLGAILAVVVYFRDRIRQFLLSFPKGASGDKTIFTHPVSLVLLAFATTSVVILAGLLDTIKGNLESLMVMGIALLVGGVVMWVIDVRFGETGKTKDVAEVGPIQAVIVGLSQVVAAVFPGASRSMSTIAGGQISGMSRSTALEFSFFLAIPTMTGAFALDLLQTLTADPGEPGALNRSLTGTDWGVLATGFVVSFFVAWAVIAWFMAWVKKRGFVPFAIYRIVIGVAILVYVFAFQQGAEAGPVVP
ncbi:MAG: undecaprenyl-diphosphate phosphatase [Planctomycetota bacterium]